MRLTWAGWTFLVLAWGCIAGLTGYCMWKVLVTTERKRRRGEQGPVAPTP